MPTDGHQELTGAGGLLRRTSMGPPLRAASIAELESTRPEHLDLVADTLKILSQIPRWHCSCNEAKGEANASIRARRWCSPETEYYG